MPPPDEDPLERAIAGALRDTIKAHGPITASWIGSAVKRIVGNIRNAKIGSLAAVMGAKGGRAGTGDSKRRDVNYAKLGKSAWAGMTDAEKSAEMRRRRLKGLKKKA